jgi:hypothetical protein
MALLNASDYGKLGDVSASQQRRSPGKFFSVFITGAIREGQEIGKLQCMTDVEKGKYLKQNQSEILFIPYFIKRYWAKYIDTKDQKGQTYSKLVAFGWNDDVPKIDDDCRYAYYIAGLLLDDNFQAMKHPEDIEAAGIKAGDPVLCFFNCGGIKFNGAMEFLNKIAEKAKDLPPLSNSPEFEKTVVYPRRFICKATVTTAESKHGDKQVFDFDVFKQLPDKAVSQVMDSSMSLMDEFEKQFDKTSTLRGGGTILSTDTDLDPDSPTFAEAPEPEPESDPITSEDFDLGI